jgi:VWFA-related protein
MLCLGVLIGAGTPPRAQVPDPAPRPIGPDEWPTFRTGTRLATIDAVVVDAQGRHVTDLTPADFEVVERGATPKVRQAIYLRAGEAGPGPVPRESPPLTAPAAPATAPRVRPLAAAGAPADTPGRTGRVIAIVVDDLGLSFESTASVRRMLARYVDTGIEPGDLVAIIRTAGGAGTLQQFTTDRRLLHAAVERVHWTVHSRSGISAFAPVVPEPLAERDPARPALPRPGEILGEALTSSFDSHGTLRVDDQKMRTELASAGTLGALEYVVRGIQALPGRKSVVFVSEGFDLGIHDHKASRTWSAFTRVMDRANRAGVVVYSLDARGLQTAGLGAEDNPQTRPPTGPAGGPPGAAAGQQKGSDRAFREVLGNKTYDRRRELMASQDTLTYLAEQTGGFAVLNTNDLNAGITRITEDARGYYLIGFETLIPVGQAWDPTDVRVRVKRRGLQVRARRGLFGPTDTSLPRDPVVADPLVAAALSPFASGAIDVRLTTLFAHDAKAGSYVRSLFFIDPAALTFVDGPDGRKDADLTLLLLGIGDNGRAVGQARLQVPLRLDPDAYRLLQQRGLLYSARLPMKSAGGYQLRAAVQDDRSKAVGSSSQFVQVPKVGKGELALSGVVMMDVASTATPARAATPDGLSDGVLGEPAVRIFTPGSDVAYTCEIYDGRGDARAVATATLLRDGRPIYTSPASAVAAGIRRGSAVRAVPVGGRLTLGQGLSPGRYTLQVSVAPGDAPARTQASQWTEFEVR